MLFAYYKVPWYNEFMVSEVANKLYKMFVEQEALYGAPSIHYNDLCDKLWRNSTNDGSFNYYRGIVATALAELENLGLIQNATQGYWQIVPLVKVLERTRN